MSVVVGTTTAQTPLNASFGGLKGQVASFVQGQNLPAVLADAGAAINSAINKLNTRNWNWLLRQESLTLAADTRTYTIAADFRRPRKLEQWDTNSKTVGHYSYLITKDFFDCDFDNTSSGTPQYYTIVNASSDRLLTFNVPPSTAFAASWPIARSTYFARIQRFAADGDTIGDLKAPPEVSEFLDWYGKWKLATTRGSAMQIREAKEAWHEYWFALIRDDRDEQTDWA